MVGRIANVQISHPGPSYGGDDYWGKGLGARLEAMYGDLLGMDRLYIGYHKLVDPDGRLPAFGFEYSREDPPPRWPDPAHPQQVHLDIEVEDLNDAEALVLAFQHFLSPAPRWPHPAYPAQLHLDLDFDDSSAVHLAERLGAIRLPLRERPDHLVYADPAGHPFCAGWPGGPS